MQLLEVIPAYVSVRLHPESLNVLVPFYTREKFRSHKPISPFDLHVTVMQSLTWFQDKDENKRLVRPIDVFEAVIEEPEELGNWVTLKLESPALIERHNVWKRAGMIHKFPEYIPHISFAKTKLRSKLADDMEIFRGLKIKLTGESVVPGRS